MDPLSATASGFAVVSLAVQLADTIKKFCDFWEDVRNAPQTLQETVAELRLLQPIVHEIYLKEQSQGPDDSIKPILTSIAGKISQLIDIVEAYQPGLSSGSRRVRTWNSFKFSIRGNQVEKLRASLMETKLTLMLARINLSDQMQFQHHERTLTAVTTGLTNLRVHSSSEKIATTIQGPSDIDDHVHAIRKDMLRMVHALGVSSTWVGNGMQSAIDKACSDLVSKLSVTTIPTTTTEQAPQEVVEKNHDVRRGDTSKCTESNLEKGFGTGYADHNSGHRQRLVSKHLAKEKFHSIYSSVSSSMFGTIYFTTNEFSIDMSAAAEELESYSETNEPFELKELRTDFTVYPAAWLVRLGLRFGLDASISTTGREWKHVLRTFHAVPDDSLVFEFCRQGNLQAVRSLIKRGEASAWDTDSRGWTPLHFAAWRCDLPLINFLKHAGADLNALTFDFPSGNYENCTPLVTAATISSLYSVPSAQRIDALRILCSAPDFTDTESQAWKMVLVLLERERPSTGLATDVETSKWVLDTFLSDLRRSYSEPLVAWMLVFCLESPDLLDRVLNLSGNMVNAVLAHEHFTPIHCRIAENFPKTALPGMKLLLERGANPHALGLFEVSYGTNGRSVIETPTSLSLRRSAFFHQWRSVLGDLGVDWKEFIRNEMKFSPLNARGWSEDSLFTLFSFRFEPQILETSFCQYCGRQVFHTFDMSEKRWEELLVRIKAGSPLEEQLWSYVSDNSLQGRISTESENDQGELCWKCGIMRRIRGSNFRREVL